MSLTISERGDGNALAAIAHKARRTSSVALLCLEASGLALALSIYALSPKRWPLMLPCFAVSAYGLWGLCDHLLESRTGRRYRAQRQVLRWAKRAVATAGTAAALGGAYLLMGWIMGVYIS